MVAEQTGLVFMLTGKSTGNGSQLNPFTATILIDLRAVILQEEVFELEQCPA